MDSYDRNLLAALRKAQARADSLQFELSAERHCHAKDNEHLLARAEAAEAMVRKLQKYNQALLDRIAGVSQ